MGAQVQVHWGCPLFFYLLFMDEFENGGVYFFAIIEGLLDGSAFVSFPKLTLKHKGGLKEV